MTNITEFTEMDLQQAKKVLEERKQKLMGQRSNMEEQDPFSDGERVSDNAALDTEASEQSDHQSLEALEGEVGGFIKKIDAALKKIDEGSWGVCDSCGQLIAKERLAIDPSFELCVQCHQKQANVKG